MQFSVGDWHSAALCYNCRQRGTGFTIRWQLFGDHCQKWGLPINSLFRFPSSSGRDQSCIFHHQASDTVIFWKWEKSIWLFILKMMFDIFSSKGCHCPPKVSYMALMAQSTGLKYFSRKNFSSCGGNPGTGAFYLSRHNLWNCGRQNFWFFSYTSEISISSFLVKARIVFICSWKHFAI